MPSATHGWATGAFGTLLSTGDGGHTWRSIGQRLDNPQGMHLNAIAPAGGGRLLIAGESGTLFLSSPDWMNWRALDTPYRGTWFGALYLRDRGRLLVFGLQGNAWYSDNNGQDWLAGGAGSENSLAGGYTDHRGNVLLAGGVGLVLVSRDSGETFEPLQLRLRESLSSVLQISRDELVTVGMGGVRLIELERTEE
ncbi:MAG: hypothetical protein U5K56_14950 [Halioglobus sp.]|nr:hypothetical protein [Halioglobus sp.]